MGDHIGTGSMTRPSLGGSGHDRVAVGGGGRMNDQASAVLVSATRAEHVAAVLVRGGVDLAGSTDVSGALPLIEQRRPQVVVVELDGGADTLGTVAELAAAVPHVPLL